MTLTQKRPFAINQLITFLISFFILAFMIDFANSEETKNPIDSPHEHHQHVKHLKSSKDIYPADKITIHSERGSTKESVEKNDNPPANTPNESEKKKDEISKFLDNKTDDNKKTKSKKLIKKKSLINKSKGSHKHPKIKRHSSKTGIAKTNAGSDSLDDIFGN